MNKIFSTAITTLVISVSANASFMDNNWAKSACDGWNANKTLTNELAGDWIKNDQKRGYKIIQIYRDECGEKTKIQLNISNQNSKAICTYGGAPDGKTINSNSDYVMHATDKDWTCIGKNEFGCGAMGAMMSGKLKFDGPKIEAMGVMGPFESFLTLTGKIPGAKGVKNCQ